MKDQEKFSNKNIAYLLKSIAAAYLLKNENRFKIIAYENAAGAVERLNRELKDLWEEGKLLLTSGIGPSIGAHLDEYFRSGRSLHFEQVLKGIPDTVFELMKMPSIGPIRAFKLATSLKLLDKNTLFTDLKRAIKTGKIAKLPSFGEKSQADILEAIKVYQNKSVKEERMPLPYAFSIASEIVDYLKKHPKIQRADVLGSLRRMMNTIGDIDLAVAVGGSAIQEIIQYFINYPKKISVDNAGKKKASIIVHPYVRIDLRAQEKETYGSMLQYFTGSKTHNIKLREFALKKGYSLSEYGITKIKNKKEKIKSTDKKANIFKFKNEESFYNFLGLQYIPPEIREGTNEIELARKNQLPKLIELTDIKGDFHMHSSYDLKPSHDLGADDYPIMLTKAKTLGYEYIGFSDHNPSLSNNTEANVVTIMKKRKEYIDKIISSQKIDQIKYFIGLEVDILPSGSIALPFQALDYVDYLIVSIHSSFRLSTEELTQRVLKALSCPKVKILGHPTGRMLGKRDGYELDWKKIFKTCQEKNIALEVNCWPERLDLPDSLVYEAIKNNIKLCINTDSHAVSQMENMFYGVEVARRGWAKKIDIINTASYDKVKTWIFS